jgi:hypothetical protein
MSNKFISSVENIDLFSNFEILMSNKCPTSEINLIQIRICLVKISKIIL